MTSFWKKSDPELTFLSTERLLYYSSHLLKASNVQRNQFFDVVLRTQRRSVRDG